MSDPSEMLAGLSLAEKRMLLAELLYEKQKQGQAIYPLSHGQRGLWFLYQLDRADASYNVFFPSRICSRLNVAAVGKMMQALIERHPSLRTTFEERGGELLQRVHDKPHPESLLQVIDASSWSEELLLAQVEEAIHRPFDLEHGPLVRLSLFSRAPDDHVFLLTAHHIIGDFWSLVIILEEMKTAYPVHCQGKPPVLPPLKTHYRDFVRWQAEMLAGPEGQRLWSYWERQLAGVETILELPTDHPRPPRSTHNGATMPCQLGKELTRRLKELATREGVTPYTVLQAGFQALLGRYSGQESFVVGSPFAGRSRPEFERVVGYFINMLPLRADLSGDPTFRELLRRVGATVLDALQHQDFPFPLLIERLKVPRDPDRAPLAQVTLTIEKARLSGQVGAWRFTAPRREEEGGVPGFQVEPFRVEHHTCQTDLELILEEGNGLVEGLIQYNTDLFDRDTIRRLVGHFLTLLEGAAADPGRRLSELPWLTEAERRQIVVEWNQTRIDFPQDVCLHKLFEQQAEKVPDAVALRFGDHCYRYAELNAWSNRVAARLRQLGAGPGTLVAVCMSRSPELIAAILGILKAGAAYVPLDPNSPAERLSAILEDTQAPILLTGAGVEEHGSGVREEEGISFGTTRYWQQPTAELTPDPCSSTPAKDLAYIIYTSGSTGRPKGVSVEHAAACNTVFWHRDFLKVRSDDRALLLVPHFFDGSVCVIFPTLAAGAELVLALPGEERDPTLLLDRIARDGVTILPSCPSVLQLLLEAGALLEGGARLRQACRTVRWVYSGGETMNPDVPARLFRYLDVELYNLYGPTEVGVDATWWSCQPGDSRPSIPIGRPIANVQVYVLDAQRQPVPVGVPGELYVGGAGIARGYLNNPELTAERFVPDPFRGVGRLYRTGDRCRWRADGTLEFLGRLDEQVKVRGYRIEPGEIEAILSSVPEVLEAAVLAVPDELTGHRLVAYVAVADQREGEAPAEPRDNQVVERLRRHLKERLPEYMMPSTFVLLPELPRTPTDKIDRKALPLPQTERSQTSGSFVAPSTPLEEFLAGLWRELLGVEQVGIEDNFFELGGNSIKAAVLIGRVQEKFGRPVYTVAIFDAPTVSGLVRYLSDNCPETVAQVFGPESVANSEPRPPGSADGLTLPGGRGSEFTTRSALLAPLQPKGHLSPLFMVHPPGGIVVCYQAMARYFEPDRPFYGIRSRGLDGEKDIPTQLEEMAAEYVAAIRQLQPEGPYHLGGWSIGGVVAFEMAQQLLAQGQQVGLLALLDTTIPYNETNREYAEHTQDSALEYGLDISLEELDKLGPDEQLPYLWQHVQRLGILDVDTPMPVAEQILDDLKRLFHAHITMANDYAMRPYPGRITLFRPTEVPVALPTAHDRGWGKIAESVEVHFVAGHHHSMVKEPQVQVIAEQLRLCLAETEAKGQESGVRGQESVRS